MKKDVGTRSASSKFDFSAGTPRRSKSRRVAKTGRHHMTVSLLAILAGVKAASFDDDTHSWCIMRTLYEIGLKIEFWKHCRMVALRPGTDVPYPSDDIFPVVRRQFSRRVP